VIDAASSLDAELFLETLVESGATVCGCGPVALLLPTLTLLPGARSSSNCSMTRHPGRG
jgi:hypothetical protein